MSRPPWKPWHDVVQLRPELKTGELSLSTFAADLYDVVMGKARPVYQDPAEFFAFTYPTLNLRNLTKDVTQRLAGKNDKAVRQLELTYGGGKTHTLITLFHLANHPEALPNLTAIQEFGELPPQARIAVLAFDKLDAEKGMEIVGPEGERRWLKQPWSVLAFQLAGSDGLRLLHPDNEDAERESAPAENLLVELLALPRQKSLSTLILIDEVLMYVREKVGLDPVWRSRMANFFQYLTQAATKVDTCVIVASLLATDPGKSDTLGKEITQELYAVFRREREEGVQPVLKGDVAEVLRRRFFTPASIQDRNAFRPHVQVALQGIAKLDDQTKKVLSIEEERFLQSYPFHPDLTDTFFVKWTGMESFQRTRGILRTFALALRDAETWDQAPLVSTNVFLGAPELADISESARELTNVAETEEYEGKRQDWASILGSELSKAREIQTELPALSYREVEQAVFATFLHSQPIGKDAKTRDLLLLLGHTNPDRIELEKALQLWTELSWFLDENAMQEKASSSGASQGLDSLPKSWRIGSRPNLRQMHHDASSHIAEEAIEQQLITEIGKCKSLKAGIPAGVHVHTLSNHPSDVGDEGEFHFVILGPKAASLVGQPSPEAQRFLDQNTGPGNLRTNRNAVVLAVPSVDGLDAARNAIRSMLGWQDVEIHLKGQDVDTNRKLLLESERKKAAGLMAEMVRQAYCIVVTIAKDNTAQAFKVLISGDSLFTVIKNDRQARIQETPVTAEALQPGGPYALWRAGETARPYNYLVGAFASSAQLPKMLNRQAIQETLLEGCRNGIFIFRYRRADQSYRTFWRETPDAVALKEPSLEIALPEFATLDSLAPTQLVPGVLPSLWQGDTLTLNELYNYFTGRILKVPLENYDEEVPIPNAGHAVVNTAVLTAVKEKRLWLIVGQGSFFAEDVPGELMTGDACLQLPPQPISAQAIIPTNLPEAWNDGTTTAQSIAIALSAKTGKILPWYTVKETIEGAFKARWLERAVDSGPWPCDYAGAKAVKIEIMREQTLQSSQPIMQPYVQGKPVSQQLAVEAPAPYTLTAETTLDIPEIQDLVEQLPPLAKATVGLTLSFSVQVKLEGSATQPISQEIRTKVDSLLAEISEKLKLH